MTTTDQRNTVTFTTDSEGNRSADHALFTCSNCGYSTTDLYTAGVINDLSGTCPECDADAGTVTDPESFPDGKGVWCSDNCGWYAAESTS